MSNYHEDLLFDEEEYFYRRCEYAVGELEMHKFEHPDAASDWIAETARKIGGHNHSFTLISQWLRELLEEDGLIPDEVYHAPISQPQAIDSPCQEPQAW